MGIGTAPTGWTSAKGGGKVGPGLEYRAAPAASTTGGHVLTPTELCLRWVLGFTAAGTAFHKGTL